MPLTSTSFTHHSQEKNQLKYVEKYQDSPTEVIQTETQREKGDSEGGSSFKSKHSKMQ